MAHLPKETFNKAFGPETKIKISRRVHNRNVTITVDADEICIRTTCGNIQYIPRREMEKALADFVRAEHSAAVERRSEKNAGYTKGNH